MKNIWMKMPIKYIQMKIPTRNFDCESLLRNAVGINRVFCPGSFCLKISARDTRARRRGNWNYIAYASPDVCRI